MHIPQLAVSECFMLENIATRTRSYKFGSTDLEFTLCMSGSTPSTDASHAKGYTVISLRDEDCFEKSANVYEVSHIFSKSNTSKLYDKMVYVDKRHSIGDLSEFIQQKLDLECIVTSSEAT